MILVSVNRIRACKKLVLYFRFLETAARQISECRGQFEILPESSQTSSINLAFASDYLDINDIRGFGLKIKEYFKLSPAFLNMFANFVMVDPELKKHCEAVKFQRVPMKDLAEYYVSYMDRMGKEADPRVKAKLLSKEYSDSLQPIGMNYGSPGNPGFYNQVPAQGGNNSGGHPQFPHPPGGHSFGGAGGGFNMGGGHGGTPPPNNFGGQGGGFNMGGGQGGFLPSNNFGGQGGGYNQQHNYNGGNNNPFSGNQAPLGPQGYGGGNQMGLPGNNGQQNAHNPFAQNQEYAKPPIMSVNMQPTPYSPPVSSPHEQQAPNKKFDDIFSDPNVPGQNASFGGDKKAAGGTKDTTDDFLKQLEDLKKL